MYAEQHVATQLLAQADMNDELLLNQIRQSLAEVIAEFTSNPADILYEADLQCLLYNSLRKRFHPYPIQSKAKDLQQLFGYHPFINPIKSKFPYNVDGLFAKFDLAVFDRNQDPLRRIWWQPCRFGIELKLWQPDGTGNDVLSDVKKLTTYREVAESRGKQFSGLALLFVHLGAERRLPNTHAKTEPKLSADQISIHIVTEKEWYGVKV